VAKSGIIHEAKAVLLDLKRMRGRMARQLDGLRAYDGWVLCKEGKKQTGHDYYDVIRPGAKRKTYLGSDRSEDVLNAIQDRIEAIYNQIVESDSYKVLEAAQNEVNALMEAVNNTITFNITGEEPSACTHDCSTCGGCH
jgi:hypothetical protein